MGMTLYRLKNRFKITRREYSLKTSRIDRPIIASYRAHAVNNFEEFYASGTQDVRVLKSLQKIAIP